MATEHAVYTAVIHPDCLCAWEPAADGPGWLLAAHARVCPVPHRYPLGRDNGLAVGVYSDWGRVWLRARATVTSLDPEEAEGLSSELHALAQLARRVQS